MKNIFARILKKNTLCFGEQGVHATKSDGIEIVIKWSNIKKIAVLDVFMEYSGYFLTEDYLSKAVYNDISIACCKNIVKIRTGGSPKIKKNIKAPFSVNYGTTSIYYLVFVEYVDDLGNKNLFANHYNENKKEEIIDKFEEFLPKDKILQNKKIEGFTPLSEL